MALYSIRNIPHNLILNNCLLLIIASAQTCLICTDRVTGETEAFASQSKLRKGHDGIRNYDAYRIV